jgi:RNA polymerase sigma factor (sigma-70 family)
MVVNAHISTWRRSGRRELSVAEVRDPEVADHAARVATGDAVWRVCGSLPPQQRAAVVLRYYEDLEYAEIAAILGVAQATVARPRPPGARCDAGRAAAGGRR